MNETLEAMAKISEELAAMRSGSERLVILYGEAAETSDLTFVKILEERYAELFREIQAVDDYIAARMKEEKERTEANGLGG
ncbi:hypothetical protein [Cohnella cellulosilytica]|uniref:Uncharacterized protein n=1 Tax=Cohnella cellulosilytica TaxID=986710 RepID=A0ABW2F6X5_9BACL